MPGATFGRPWHLLFRGSSGIGQQRCFLIRLGQVGAAQALDGQDGAGQDEGTAHGLGQAEPITQEHHGQADGEQA